MIKIEHLDVWGFHHAIRGMRNPMNSWRLSDSEWLDVFSEDNAFSTHDFCIGKSDLTLMKSLFKEGTPARKYLRQIFISMDITAPLYWWKEFDTYKVGTVSNSCSTMHKLTSRDLSIDDFSYDHIIDYIDLNEHLEFEPFTCLVPITILTDTIRYINALRLLYLKTKNKQYWYTIIQLLPSSYNQKRTITMSYENVVTILQWRSNHKLDEWRDLCKYFRENLPYINEITGGVDKCQPRPQEKQEKKNTDENIET